MNDDAADGEEPDDDVEGLGEAGDVGPLDAVDGDAGEEVETEVEVEDGGDADGAEEANEDCLALFRDLVDELV